MQQQDTRAKPGDWRYSSSTVSAAMSRVASAVRETGDRTRAPSLVRAGVHTGTSCPWLSCIAQPQHSHSIAQPQPQHSEPTRRKCTAPTTTVNMSCWCDRHDHSINKNKQRNMHHQHTGSPATNSLRRETPTGTEPSSPHTGRAPEGTTPGPRVHNTLMVQEAPLARTWTFFRNGCPGYCARQNLGTPCKSKSELGSGVFPP